MNNCIDVYLAKLKSEAVRIGDNPNLYTQEVAKYMIEQELTLLPKNVSRIVSDAFSGATLNEISDSWKHDTDYWKQDSNLLCNEFFAETFSSLIVNPDAIETMKRYIPKSFEIFNRILHDIAK